MSTLITNIREGTKAVAQSEVTMVLEGSLNNATVSSFEEKLAPILAVKPAQLIFDLAGLKFVTSAGIQVLFSAVKQQKEHGGQTSFVHLQPQVKEVFNIVANLPDVKVFRDQAELDAYLLARQKTNLDWQKDQLQ
jgi:anti-anti-sigma factor